METLRSRVWVLSFESAGLLLSLVLTAMHYGWISQESVPCPRGTIFACGSILKGSWSTIYGIPWALLGALYFLGHIALTALTIRIPSASLLKGLGLLSGIAVVVGLRSVELIHLRKICPLCWLVALLTISQVIAAWRFVSQLPPWNLAKRIAAVVITALALHGVILTVLLLGHDPRRSPAAQSTTPPTSPTTAITESQSTGTLFQRPTLNQHPGSPILGPEIDGILAAGWVVTSNPALVQEALSKPVPTLLFAYDPLCVECHATMKGGLSDKAANAGIPALLVAAEESALPPEISGEVKQVPTLLLIRNGTQVVWRHEGRIETPALAEQVRKALQ